MTSILFLVAGAALLNVYAAALVLARAPAFKTRLYTPMLVNIGMSILPTAVLAITSLALLVVATTTTSTPTLWVVLVIGAVAWLLVLPNAGYLITELNFSHRREDDPTPLWFDIVLVMTLALSGVVNALVNVGLVQTLVALLAWPNDATPLVRPEAWIAAVVAIVLMPVGIYVGRYVRFNSWDVVRPVAFLRKLSHHFGQQGKVGEFAGFWATYTIFFAIAYVTVAGPAIGLLLVA